MARPLRIEYPNAFYHVIQRGTEKRNIFLTDRDNETFLSYINRAHHAYGIFMHTYTLMKNHYHLIAETPRANLNKAMHYINASYAIYFNTKEKRVGPLYQGRYKAILIQEDEYIHQLSRYIHLNPVRAGIVKDPAGYPWSSYRYFVSQATPPKWLRIDLILTMFGINFKKAKVLYRDFVLSGIGKEKSIILNDTKKGCILGNDIFYESIKRKFVNQREDPEIPEIRQLKKNTAAIFDCIIDMVKEKVRGNAQLQKKVCIYFLRKHTDITLRGIADYYGNMNYKNVSTIYQRVHKQRTKSKSLDELLEQIEISLVRNLEMTNDET